MLLPVLALLPLVFLPLCWSLPIRLCKACLTHHFLPAASSVSQGAKDLHLSPLKPCRLYFPPGLDSISYHHYYIILCTIISFVELAIFKNYIKIRLHGHKAKRFGKGNKGLADNKGQTTEAREARHSRIRLRQGQRELLILAGHPGSAIRHFLPT